jgi:hypothetical protein
MKGGAKMLMRRKDFIGIKYFLIIGIGFSFFVVASSAFADNITPPYYDGWINSVYAEWTTFNDGDLASNFKYYEGKYPLNDYNENGIYGKDDSLLIITSGGEDVYNYKFYLPNFLDNLSIKLMRIQVEYNIGYLPEIQRVVGIDKDGYYLGQKTYSWGNDQNYFYEDWKIHPNPDWEWVEISLPKGGSFRQVAIHTISTTPEPAAIFLLGAGLLGLAVLKRRFRKS